MAIAGAGEQESPQRVGAPPERVPSNVRLRPTPVIDLPLGGDVPGDLPSFETPACFVGPNGDRVALWGLHVDRITEAEAVGVIVSNARARRGGVILTPNVELLRQFRENAAGRRHLETADLLLADGAPLVWASRIARRGLPERVAGSTLTWALAGAAAEEGLSLFLLGGDPGVAERAASRLEHNFRGIGIAGVHCPPVGFEDLPDELAAMRDAVRSADPDIVLIALPFPKQARVAEDLRAVHPRACFIGVGISLSFVSGDVHRAPVVLQRLGLEWAHRLAQEPRRLFRRYIVDGLPFAVRLLVWSVRVRYSSRTVVADRT